MFYEPLFNSYVFVYIDETETKHLKQIDNIVSLVYWKGHPAVIKNNELIAIKQFTSLYQNIKLERTQVNMSDKVEIIDEPTYSIDGKVLTVKNNFIKVNLPSVGFIMIAEMDKETVMGRERISETKLLFQN